jgi:ATP-dependent DNA ligase
MLLKPPLPPMEARSVEEIPTGDEWQYEPKWDGFRCLLFRDGEKIFLQSKNSQPLARYFPDVVESVAKLPQQEFVLDGELVIPVRGALSFDELQLRLHPAASRVQKLAAAHPAVYIFFDLLAEDGESYLKLNLRERRRLLEKFSRLNLRSAKNIRLSAGRTHCSRKGKTNADRRLCYRWLPLRDRRARDRFPFARTLWQRRITPSRRIYLRFRSVCTARVNRKI